MVKSDKFRILSRDAVKYIAVFFMTVGHFFGWTFNGDWQQSTVLQIFEHFSVIAPPIFFFSIADGYRYTSSRKKYALRLLLCAVITQIPTWLLFWESEGWRHFNVVFTLFFGLLSIMIWETKLKIWQKITFIALLDLVTYIFIIDWAIFGIPLMLVIHIFREKPKQRFIGYTIITFIVAGSVTLLNIYGLQVWINGAVEITAFMTAYFLVTKCCNGRKGRFPVFSKWFFYIFYPAHTMIILIAKILINR